MTFLAQSSNVKESKNSVLDPDADTNHHQNLNTSKMGHI